MKEIYSLEPIVEIISRLVAEMETAASEQGQFAELSMRQVYYLDTILRLENPTFSDLAQQFGVSKPSVTALVGKLIEKGFVEKVQSEADRRVYYIRPTEKAAEFARLHQATHQKMAQYLVRNLDEAEVQQLVQLLLKAV